MRTVEDVPNRLMWDRYTDGKVYAADQGVDFFGTPKQFRACAYAAARTRDMKVITRVVGSTVYFRFVRL